MKVFRKVFRKVLLWVPQFRPSRATRPVSSGAQEAPRGPHTTPRPILIRFYRTLLSGWTSRQLDITPCSLVPWSPGRLAPWFLGSLVPWLRCLLVPCFVLWPLAPWIPDYLIKSGAPAPYHIVLYLAILNMNRGIWKKKLLFSFCRNLGSNS